MSRWSDPLPPPARKKRRAVGASSPAAPLRCPQLSLFDAPAEEGAVGEGESGAVVAMPTLPQAPCAEPSPAVALAPEAVVPGPVPGLEEPGLPSPPFTHPLAESRIELKGCMVAYALRRARRRSIGLLVGLDGLRVSAPRWATRRDIETALNDKADWIVRKLVEQRERGRQMLAAQVEWRAGATLPYGGGALQVQLAEATAWLPEADPPTLQLGLPADADPAAIQAAVVAWLKQQARALFAQRCAHFAPLLKVQHTQIHLSSAQTRWGSAHASGVIRLNWRLIHFGLPVVDYVVAHELAHLREMNHSPRFWALVASVVPDVAAAQRVLKDTVLPVWR
jgi:predicted metal-dependent hydrolase